MANLVKDFACHLDPLSGGLRKDPLPAGIFPRARGRQSSIAAVARPVTCGRDGRRVARK